MSLTLRARGGLTALSMTALLLAAGAAAAAAAATTSATPTPTPSAAANDRPAAVPGPAPYASSSLNFSPPAAGGPPAGAAAGSGAATAPGEDIRDIRGPKYLFPAWLIAALAVGTVLLALAAYGAWRWLRGRKRPRELLPFEAALQRLEELRPLMLPERAREFSVAVSDIVRGYIERRFDVTATHRTTEEFLRDLLESSQPSLVKHRALLSTFLQQCDLVKFGGMSLPLQNIESLQQSARSFVLETAKPDPTPEPGAAVAGAARPQSA